MSENPPWSGWDVLSILGVTVASVVVLLLATSLAVERLLYPTVPWVEVVQFPLVTVFAQLIAYVLILAFMISVVRRRPEGLFWRDVRWNWPRNWAVYLSCGVALSIGLQLLAHWLPMPKEVPLDRFFQTARQAWAIAVFGATIAPLMEELFFRGFLYPVLARRLGVAASIVLTALAFSVIHAPQLGKAWAPVLVIFLVGLALTVTRAITKSVAAGMLIHVAYNSTISVLMFIATDGFRHLEKLGQH